MIVDFHVHAGQGDGMTGPWDTGAPLARYAARATRAGIARSVLLPVFQSDYAQGNRDVAALVRGDPHRWIGFAMVHAERDRPRIHTLIEEAVLTLGLRGIKVHRHDARINRHVCDAARRFRLPVLYDPAGDVGALELLAQTHPDVAFVFAHLGSFADDWAAQRRVVDLIVRYPNLFSDTAGVRRFDLLEEAFRRAGPSKLLFGTDGPWLHPGLELAKLRALHPAPAAFAAMAGGNALRLLGPPRRAAAPSTARFGRPDLTP
ncbi:MULTISPECIES: amidohydrolase family protein [Paraburkholderia]|uniref:amidohydrolase family protein n=1 Tax=Paraburkholderia TaxID=1822464 RepID=UPI00035E5416|nr:MULTISPECIES: amidohydrolase family protein [Paraburkholderia]MDH6153321.1 putative TIM-barrel fold metal-dependent hydrolase [Paraburkholderia sp. WSM4179]